MSMEPLTLDSLAETDVVRRPPTFRSLFSRMVRRNLLYDPSHDALRFLTSVRVDNPSILPFSYDTDPPWTVPTSPVYTYLSSVSKSSTSHSNLVVDSYRIPSPTMTRYPCTLMSQNRSMGWSRVCSSFPSVAICCHLHQYIYSGAVCHLSSSAIYTRPP